MQNNIPARRNVIFGYAAMFHAKALVGSGVVKWPSRLLLEVITERQLNLVIENIDALPNEKRHIARNAINVHRPEFADAGLDDRRNENSGPRGNGRNAGNGFGAMEHVEENCPKEASPHIEEPRAPADTAFEPKVHEKANSEADVCLERSNIKWSAGDHAGMIEELAKAVELDPKLEDSWHLIIMRGEARYFLGDKEGYNADHGKAMELLKGAKYGHLAMEAYSSLCEGRGSEIVFSDHKIDPAKHQKRILYNDLAIAVNPQSAKAYYNRGILKHELGDVQGAKEDFRKAGEINPEKVREEIDFERTCAQSYFIRKKYAEAKIFLGRLLMHDPKNAVAYYFRGIANVGLQDNKGAIDDITKAIGLGYDKVGAYLIRSTAKKALGDNEGAEQDIAKGRKISPERVAGFEKLGYEDYLVRLYQLIDQSKVVAQYPNDAAAIFNRAIIKEAMGDKTGAMEDLGKARKADPARARELHDDALETANRHFNSKDYELAIFYFDRAIGLEPENANSWEFRGIAKAQLQDYAGALADISKAIELNQTFAQAYHNRGVVKRALNDEQGAEEDFAIAEKLKSDSETGPSKG